MYEPKDTNGQALKVGDIIAYTSRKSTTMNTHVAIIDDIVDIGVTQHWYRYQLCVRVYDKHKVYVGHGWVSGVYRRRLVSNETVIKLDRSIVPLDMLEAFDRTERFNCTA